MGAPDISILEAVAKPQMARRGAPTQIQPSEAPAVTLQFNPGLVRDFDQVKAALAAHVTVADARPAGRAVIIPGGQGRNRVTCQAR
jgi:hypothetical protein